MNLDEVLDKHDELRRRNRVADPPLLEQAFAWDCGEGRSILLQVTRTTPLGAPVDEFDYSTRYCREGADDIPGSGRVDAQMINKSLLGELLREANDNWPKY